uniref:Uncharacterized protein n=1 Tax=Nomascus leucogenys TaxID=61853 RepID=A0A2I3FVS6_NOMLE
MWTLLLPQPGVSLGHASAVPGWNSRASEAGSEIGRYRLSGPPAFRAWTSGFLFGRQISLGKRRQTFVIQSKCQSLVRWTLEALSSLSLEAFKKRLGQARWLTPVIPDFGRPRQADHLR